MMKTDSFGSIGMKRFFSLMIVLILLLSICCVAPASAEESEDEVYVPSGDRIIVSMGDSYSSGEGIPPFYGSDKEIAERVLDDDWIAHRSQGSWPGQLKLGGVEGEMKDHRNSNWFFIASSGATTDDVKNYQRKPYNRSENLRDDNRKLPPQIDIFNHENLAGKTVDYVTMTFGGNDVDFAGIVEMAVQENEPQALRDKLSYTWEQFYQDNSDGIRNKLIRAYSDIYDATNKNAKLVVAGYPKLFTSDGTKIYFIKEVSKEEADIINSNVSLFNQAIQNAVNQCKADGMKTYFVTVEDLFDGHAAYDSDAYINEVDVNVRDDDLDNNHSFFDFIGSAFSVHPNEKGAKAYATRVSEVLRCLDQQRAPRKPDPRFNQVENLGERDVVLVLDKSGSMSGTPLDNTKEASRDFIDSVNNSEANIGVVEYSSAATIACNFTLDSETLKAAVDDMSANGGTNIDDGLSTAEAMLNSKSSTAAKKIIVLMSDGQANEGRTGEELIQYAQSLKDKGIYIYTLGFFDELNSGEKAQCQYVMEKIASPGCHYEVTDPESLVFFFGDIADQINGQKYIYIRIACPVDVSVMHSGEKLDSSSSGLTTRASFGTLTFEDTDTQSSSYSDYDTSGSSDSGDRVKILRLKEGEDYDIRINGTGEGTMTYKINFMDENGEYADFREFEDVPITTQTRIDTVADIADNTVMNVDKDNDGIYDVQYVAEANDKGAIVERQDVKASPIGTIYLIVMIAGAVITLFFLLLQILREKREAHQTQP